MFNTKRTFMQDLLRLQHPTLQYTRATDKLHQWWEQMCLYVCVFDELRMQQRNHAIHHLMPSFRWNKISIMNSIMLICTIFHLGNTRYAIDVGRAHTHTLFSTCDVDTGYALTEHRILLAQLTRKLASTAAKCTECFFSCCTKHVLNNYLFIYWISSTNQKGKVGVAHSHSLLHFTATVAHR